MKISAAVYAKPEDQRLLVVEIDMRIAQCMTRALRAKKHAPGVVGIDGRARLQASCRPLVGMAAWEMKSDDDLTCRD